MLRFAQTADSIAATGSKLAKIALVADYLRSLSPEQAAIAAIFLSRHESGYALRFPRIVRLRRDKLAEDADNIETVKQIFQRQHSS